MGGTEGKRKKQNKKNENEVKNIFGFTHDGIKSCAGQDTYHYFGFEVENTNIKFKPIIIYLIYKYKKCNKKPLIKYKINKPS